AHEYLDPLVAAGVDTLILGCTHYPLLTGMISYVMGDGVTLVSSAEECAKDVYRVLLEHGLERTDLRVQ
ncbi:MAG: aspartate/glutamate racemase family protein, partial [Nocardioidaceae bacterium]|nr:aspartate/glutamate racemase family protein [Nocardioidaceae bacterium]